MGADSVDLVHEVLHTMDAILAKGFRNDLIILEGDAVLVDLSVSPFVDQLPHRLQRRIAVRNEGSDQLEHLGGGLVHFDEHSVVDLQEAEQLKDLARLRSQLVDTLDANGEYELRIRLLVEAPLGTRFPAKGECVLLLSLVLLLVLESPDLERLSSFAVPLLQFGDGGILLRRQNPVALQLLLPALGECTSRSMLGLYQKIRHPPRRFSTQQISVSLGLELRWG
mmetsp:Transcript_8943/g.21942  ORF Transcript_8943/g.21942 Transcript_8943/m.21942 type:complete len:224 (+) Transcript_8943:2225-2896(+)